MEPAHDIGTLHMMSALIRNTFVGMVIGMSMGISIPFRSAMNRKQTVVGFGAAFACAIVGALGGFLCFWFGALFLTAPVAFFLRMLICTLPDRTEDSFDYLSQDPSIKALTERGSGRLPKPDLCGYQQIGSVITCDSCESSSRVEADGSVPKRCPTCAAPFSPPEPAKSPTPPANSRPTDRKSEKPKSGDTRKPSGEVRKGGGFSRKAAFEQAQQQAPLSGDDIVPLRPASDPGYS